ncbi:MAG: hypothetical protein PWP31_2015 [Clostridia bacterium]|nr:hypothetical protein [Clostridia bacterium]
MQGYNPQSLKLKLNTLKANSPKGEDAKLQA